MINEEAPWGWVFTRGSARPPSHICRGLTAEEVEARGLGQSNGRSDAIGAAVTKEDSWIGC